MEGYGNSWQFNQGQQCYRTAVWQKGEFVKNGPSPWSSSGRQLDLGLANVDLIHVCRIDYLCLKFSGTLPMSEAGVGGRGKTLDQST